MRKIIFAVFLTCFLHLSGWCVDKTEITRVDPPNWWVGMKENSLQLCVYGKDISSSAVSIDYAGVTVTRVNKVENPDYLFIDLSIAGNTLPGGVDILFTSGKEHKTYKYQLLKRTGNKDTKPSYSPNDFVYMLMPDRFANGDPSNDIIKTCNETQLNRDSMFYRHGGDIQGVINHLDYIKDLGATAVWLTPVQENNEPRTSYHGYAITDHYKIDPRFGTNDLYTQFVSAAHDKGLKVTMDMVYNHVGTQHWFIKSLPSQDWIHQSDTFLQTNYRVTTLMDPHASEYDKHRMTDGWFVKSMPDLNQKNTFLARYLIQNSIWWIESTGIDGFRIDTYAYSDLQFMSNLMAAVKKEYPRFNAVGELWDHAVAYQAYMMQHSKIPGAPETNLPGLIDFQLCFAVSEALNKPMDWTDGLTKIYYTLSQDFLYSDPDKNLTFLDNHDLSRFYSVVGEDIRKFKMGIGFLLTTRGTPCIYYGTEILMKNFSNPDGKVREDFPGGWAGDKLNKFTYAGRTPAEQDAFGFVKKLAQYRREHEVLRTGALTQFVPENDTYVYFRSNPTSTVMVIMHYGDKGQQLDLARFNEKLSGYTKGINIITGKEVSVAKPITLDGFSIQVIKLQK
jgi:glycosidase